RTETTHRGRASPRAARSAPARLGARPRAGPAAGSMDGGPWAGPTLAGADERVEGTRSGLSSARGGDGRRERGTRRALAPGLEVADVVRQAGAAADLTGRRIDVDAGRHHRRAVRHRRGAGRRG